MAATMREARRKADPRWLSILLRRLVQPHSPPGAVFGDQLADADVADGAEPLPVADRIPRQNAQQQHLDDDAVRDHDARPPRSVGRDPLPYRHNTTSNVVERLGAVWGVAGVAGHPAGQGVGPDAVAAAGRRAA